MLFSDIFDYPDNDLGIVAGRIRDNLSEMVVIGFLQLVLYCDLTPGCLLFGENVNAESSNMGLGLDRFYVDPYLLA
jgi:hypothetical protein